MVAKWFYLLFGAIFVSQASAFGINATCSFTTVNNFYTCNIKNALILVDDEPVTILGNPGNTVNRVTITESRTLFIIRELFTKFPTLITLEITGSGLRFIVPGVFANASLLSLVIENNNLEALEAGAFSGLEKLADLRILNSNLKRLDAGAFANLPRLVQVYFSNLKFPTLSTGVFANLPSLVLVSMSGGSLQSVESHAFNNSLALETLKISMTNLKNIHENAFFGLRSLKTLELGYNQIEDLPTKVLHPLRSIVRVDLENNLLSRLDNDLFLQNGANLKDLFLRDNNISSIGPYFFDNLVSLTSLFMTGNQCVNRSFSRSNSNFLDIIRQNMTICFENYEDEPLTTLIPTTEALTTTSQEVTTSTQGFTTPEGVTTTTVDPETEEERTFVIKVRGRFVVFDENGKELLRA